MTLTMLHDWKHRDASADLNSRFKHVFAKGFVNLDSATGFEGLLTGSGSSLEVDVDPFICVTSDGAVVVSDDTETLTVSDNVVTYIVLRARHRTNNDPILSIEKLTAAEFSADPEAEWLHVVGVVDLVTGTPHTNVPAANISYTSRNELDQQSRSPWREPVVNAAALPTAAGHQNRTGDLRVQLDTMALKAWNGTAWVDASTGLTVPVATDTTQGTTRLSYAAGTPLDPVVLPLNANGAVTNTATGSNSPAFIGTGHGTGAGIRGTGGSTSGPGVEGFGATNSPGVNGTGQGTGAGVEGTGGATGPGVKGTGAAGNQPGVLGAGNGTGAGVEGTGGATGPGVKGTGGSTSGAGVEGTTNVSGSASPGVKGTASSGNNIGVEGQGNGSAPGVKGTGGATGVGVEGVGGSSTQYGVKGTGTNGAAGVYGTSATGPGVLGEGGTGSSGGTFQGNGAGDGVVAMGGATGDGAYGSASGSGKAGVYGETTHASGYGVVAENGGSGTGVSLWSKQRSNLDGDVTAGGDVTLAGALSRSVDGTGYFWVGALNFVPTGSATTPALSVSSWPAVINGGGTALIWGALVRGLPAGAVITDMHVYGYASNASTTVNIVATRHAGEPYNGANAGFLKYITANTTSGNNFTLPQNQGSAAWVAPTGGLTATVADRTMGSGDQGVYMHISLDGNGGSGQQNVFAVRFTYTWAAYGYPN